MRTEKGAAKTKKAKEETVEGIGAHTPKSPEENPPKVVERLAPLKTIKPAGINAVAEDEWVEIKTAVDSGAFETVMAEETPNGIIDITESAAC